MAQSNRKKSRSSLEWPTLDSPFKRKKFSSSKILDDTQVRAKYLVSVVRLGALAQLAKNRVIDYGMLSVRSLDTYIDFTEVKELADYYGESRIPLRYICMPENEQQLWAEVLETLLKQLDQHLTSCSLISRTIDHLAGV